MYRALSHGKDTPGEHHRNPIDILTNDCLIKMSKIYTTTQNQLFLHSTNKAIINIPICL